MPSPGFSSQLLFAVNINTSKKLTSKVDFVNFVRTRPNTMNRDFLHAAKGRLADVFILSDPEGNIRRYVSVTGRMDSCFSAPPVRKNIESLVALSGLLPHFKKAASAPVSTRWKSVLFSCKKKGSSKKINVRCEIRILKDGRKKMVLLALLDITEWVNEPVKPSRGGRSVKKSSPAAKDPDLAFYFDSILSSFNGIIVIYNRKKRKIEFYKNNMLDMISTPTPPPVITADILGKSVHPEDLKRITNALSFKSKSAKGVNFEVRILRNDKSNYHWFKFRTVPIKGDRDRRVVCLLMDVNDRMTNEMKLASNRDTIMETIRNMPAIVFNKDRFWDGEVTYMNRFCEQITGYRLEDFSNGRIRMEKLVINAPRYIDEELVRKKLKKSGSYEIEYPILTKNGERKWLREYGVSKNTGDTKLIEGFITDITAERSVLSELKKSEKRLSEAQQVAMIGNWDWCIATGDLYWSQEIYRIFNKNPKTFKASYTAFLGMIHPDDVDFVQMKVDNALRYGEPYDIVHRIVPAKGILRYVREVGSVVYDQLGVPMRMIGTVQDITRQVELEQEYRRAYHTLENSINALINTDRTGRLIYANPAAARVWGYDCVKTMIEARPRVYEYLQGADRAKVVEITEQLLATGAAFKGADVFAYRHNDGKTIYAITSISALRDDTGSIQGLTWSFVDVTDKIDAEHRLKKYDERLEYIFSNIDEVVYSITFSGSGSSQDRKIVFVSPSCKRKTGFLPEEFFNDRNLWISRIHPDDIPELQVTTERCISEKLPVRRLYRMKHRGGEYIWFEENITPMFDGSGKVIGYNGIARDVSERIIFEKELFHRKETYKSLFENALVGIFRTHISNQRPVAVNQTCVRLFSFHSQEEMLREFSLNDYLKDMNVKLTVNKALAESGGLENMIVQFVRKDGSLFWGNLSVKIIPGTSEMEGVVINVSTQMEHELELRKSVAEKELLLKEVHHRVKNNLQVISGLLELQLQNISEPMMMLPLLESKERIMSIALVHEKIYQGSSLSEINFTEYIQELVHSIIRVRSDKTIRVKYYATDIVIDIERAIPLGLIFNELVSNSYKHAFKAQDAGEIRFDFWKEAGMAFLKMTENGTGFDISVLSETSSLGWRLVYALTRQIKGSIDLNSEPGKGTSVLIIIPVD